MIGQAQVQPNIYADPGDTTAVIFEAPARLANYQRGEVWIGASGSSLDWGSCNVLVSMDGTSYKQIGSIQARARMGTLDSSFASGSDPDTSNSLVVDLALNSPPLDAGTTADADQANTLCYVDGELVATSACAISGQDQFTMGTYIRRGLFGSTIGAHSAGSEFVRLDDAVFQFEYDPTWAGKTVYFKFQSVNIHGNNAQDPSTLTAIPFFITGLLAPPPAGTVAIINPNFEIGADLPPYGWVPSPNNTSFSPSLLGYDTSTPYQGSRSLSIETASSTLPTTIRTTQKYAVTPGDSYRLSGAIKAVTGGTLQEGIIQLTFCGLNDSDIKGNLNLQVFGGTSGWQFVSGTGVVPTGSTYTYINLIAYTSVTHPGVGQFEFDSIQLVRMPNLSSDVVGSLPVAQISGTLPISQVGARSGSIQYVIDGAGSVVTTGVKGQVTVPANCTINSWVITADQSGSAVVDVLHSTYSGFPTTSSIAGTDKPTLSSAQKNQNAGPLSAWTLTSLAAGDILQFSVSSCSTCTRLIVTLNVAITG